MYISGILIGGLTFLLIGAFHPVVIKAEYHWGKRCWPVFLAAGVAAALASLWIADTAGSILTAEFGICCLWSIKELFEQEERVKKGWFPKKPDREAAEKEAEAES